MEKKKAIKIVTATAIAASAFTAVAPTQSEAATSLTSQIKTAKATIKKPYDTYINATKTPASLTTVKNQIAAAKKAKASINAAIKKAKLTTKQKNAKYAEIKAYDQYITRAEGYVAALSISVVGAKNQLATAIASGNDADKLAKQTALKTKIAQFKTAVAKVYGKNTRSLLLSYYVTPAQKLVDSVVFDVKIESVSALDSTNKYLQINFSNPVKSLTPSDIQVKAVKKGDVFGVKAVTLAADGKSAQVELLSNTDSGSLVLEKNTDYSVTVNANGQKVSSIFNVAAFFEGRVIKTSVDNTDFTVEDKDNGSTLKIEVPAGTDFDYNGALGEDVRVWYNDNEELVNYQIDNKASITDAVYISDIDQITTLSNNKEYDISDQKYVDNNSQYKFSFYINGEKIALDAKGNIPATYKNLRYNYAKTGFDKNGNIEYVSAYTLNDFLIVKSVEGNEVVGVKGEGTGGSFDAKHATIVKDGKVISRSDLKEGDVLFFDRTADSKNGFAEVYSKAVTGNITQVYSDSVEVNGKTYKYINSSSLSKDFGGLTYQNAVYINKDGETEKIEDTDAEGLQAAGPVSIYTDRAGNTAYIAGDTTAVAGNEKTVVLTDAVTTDYSYGKYNVQIEGLLSNGDSTIYSTNLNSLDKIAIDGVEYDIDDKSTSANKWTASFVTSGDTITLTNNADHTTRTVDLTTNALEGGAGAVVKLNVDKNNTLKEVQFFTTTKTTGEDEGSAVLDVRPTTVSKLGSGALKAGDDYIKAQQGSKKLKSSTIVFDAYESGDGDHNTYNDKDIAVSTWGQYKGADIDKATAIYDHNNEVVALVIDHTTSKDTTDEEMYVTGTVKNTDNEVIRITGYVNGVKKTLQVDKLTDSVAKGNVAIVVTDDNNPDLVKHIYSGTTAADAKTAVNGYLGAGYVSTGLAVTDVNVGQREVTFDSNGDGTGDVTYKLVSSGLVLNGTNVNDIIVKQLSDLRGQKDVTVELDEKGGTFAKFFVYNEGTAPTPPTTSLAPTAASTSPVVVTSATGDSALVSGDIVNLTFSERLTAGSLANIDAALEDVFGVGTFTTATTDYTTFRATVTSASPLALGTGTTVTIATDKVTDLDGMKNTAAIKFVVKDAK